MKMRGNIGTGGQCDLPRHQHCEVNRELRAIRMTRQQEKRQAVLEITEDLGE